MDSHRSDDRGSSPAWQPLTREAQWQNVLAHHAGQWNGLLVRFDGAGKVFDVLDSIRRFTPSSDGQTITHALDFRSRLTETVTQKQWVLTPGEPLITHPVDPAASLVFNQSAPDVMVGGDRLRPGNFYFEPYLRVKEKRISVVVMYRSSEIIAQPNLISLFREVRADESAPWWSTDTGCSIQPLSQFNLLTAASETTQVSLENLQYRLIALESRSITGDFLQIQFPDGIDLVVSRDRVQTPYYASLKWTAEPEQVTRSCSLLYDQPNQAAELLAI